MTTVDDHSHRAKLGFRNYLSVVEVYYTIVLYSSLDVVVTWIDFLLRFFVLSIDE